MSVIITAERPDHPDAVSLIDELQAHLASLYPVKNQHGFSVQRLIDQNVAFFVLRVDGHPAACGGIMFVGRDYGELKRMYVRPTARRAGLGQQLLDHLAAHALAADITVLRLETGIHQRAAIRLYERAGFTRIPPFGGYPEDPVSCCFEKLLTRA